MFPAYKAAIVGAWSIGHDHMDSYSRVDEVEVAAVVDPVANAREQYQREFGIPNAYETIEEMLVAEEPDIVCQPSDTIHTGMGEGEKPRRERGDQQAGVRQHENDGRSHEPGPHAIDGSRFVLGDSPARWVTGAAERISNKHEHGVDTGRTCREADIPRKDYGPEQILNKLLQEVF